MQPRLKPGAALLSTASTSRRPGPRSRALESGLAQSAALKSSSFIIVVFGGATIRSPRLRMRAFAVLALFLALFGAGVVGQGAEGGPGGARARGSKAKSRPGVASGAAQLRRAKAAPGDAAAAALSRIDPRLTASTLDSSRLRTRGGSSTTPKRKPGPGKGGALNVVEEEGGDAPAAAEEGEGGEAPRAKRSSRGRLSEGRSPRRKRTKQSEDEEEDGEHDGDRR